MHTSSRAIAHSHSRVGDRAKRIEYFVCALFSFECDFFSLLLFFFCIRWMNGLIFISRNDAYTALLCYFVAHFCIIVNTVHVLFFSLFLSHSSFLARLFEQLFQFICSFMSQFWRCSYWTLIFFAVDRFYKVRAIKKENLFFVLDTLNTRARAADISVVFLI